jgi:hypothetical protein
MGDELSFATTLNSICGVLFENKKYNYAIKFSMIAEQIYEKHDQKKDQARCWRNISVAYDSLGVEKEKMAAREKCESLLKEVLQKEMDSLASHIQSAFEKTGAEVTIERTLV